MPWFKVDDTLHSHPKPRRAGLAAMGMWSLAGSYASQYVTEGFIPEWFVSSWPSGRKCAAELVRAELWTPGERDGEQGWWFHDWDHYQPSKDEVERDRESNRERQRRFREKRREAKRNAARNAVTNTVTNAVSNGTPTRPDPTRPEQGLTQVGEERPVTLRAADATKHSPNKPTNPADARCTAHIGVADPGPCKGCKAAREDAERKAERVAQQIAREAEEAVKGCPDCHGSCWRENTDGTPVDPPRRCDHPRIRRTA